MRSHRSTRHRTGSIAGWLLRASLLTWAGCAAPVDRFGDDVLADELRTTTGFGIRVGDDADTLPPDVDLEDGVDESEAIAIALWNNQAFREALEQLGLRRADLAVAGLIQNPMLSMFFPIGPKQLEFTVFFPIESLLLRPGRIEAAEFDCERVSRQLMQGGVDLIRDVHRGFVDLWIARRSAELARSSAAARKQTEQLLEIRVREGEAAPLEFERARVARTDGDRAVIRADADVSLATARLKALLGFAPEDPGVAFGPATARLDDVTLLRPSANWTTEAAFAARPDLRAAELAVEFECSRAGIAGWQWLHIAPLLDANGQGKDGFEIGPGLQANIPLFDQGDAQEMQAEARVRAAVAGVATVRQRIALEVAEARAAFDLAAADVRALRDHVLPAARAASEHAAAAVELGDAEPTIALDAELRLIDVQQQEALAVSQLRRARADLERSCGYPPATEAGS